MSTESIVYIENDKSWLFDGETFTPCELSAVKKHQAGISMPLSTLQVGNYKFPSSLSTLEKQIQTEIKMHDEGGLSSEKDYEISTFDHTLEFESSTLVEAFACPLEDIKECCQDIVKQTKVIDWIVPSFITYESFYAYEESESTVDLFFYISDTESYAVLFQDKKYRAHRRTSSLEELAKEAGMDIVRCKRLLSEYGLKGDNYPEEEKLFFDQLESLFSKQIEKIVHTINHKRGLFGIEGIDRIYIDFENNNLSGIENIFSAYGIENIPVEALRCTNAISTENTAEAETNRFIKAMYIYLCANEKIESPINLTPYERQQAWYKKHSGVLIGVSTAALILGLIHPSFYYVQGELVQTRINEVQSTLDKYKSEIKLLSLELKSLKDERKNEEVKLLNIKDKSRVYTLTLDTLPVLMNAGTIRQKMMYDAVKILQDQKLSAVSMEQDGTVGMDIHVISEYVKRDSIARFMKKWMQKGYSDAVTDEIYLDNNIYESKIRVLR